MTAPEPARFEAVIDRLPVADQLGLMECLARPIGERFVHLVAPRERELVEMSNDPAIQRELRGIEAEFVMIGFDGLEGRE